MERRKYVTDRYRIRDKEKDGRLGQETGLDLRTVGCWMGEEGKNTLYTGGSLGLKEEVIGGKMC